MTKSRPDLPDSTSDTEVYTVHTAEGPITFHGRLLGSATSRRDIHLHPPGKVPPPGKSCSGCRWVVIRIYWSADSDSYVVCIDGHSAIDGEETRYKTIWAANGIGVIDALLVTRSHRQGPHSSTPSLPPANAEALEEAADADENIEEALIEYEDKQNLTVRH